MKTPQERIEHAIAVHREWAGVRPLVAFQTLRRPIGAASVPPGHGAARADMTNRSGFPASSRPTEALANLPANLPEAPR